MTQARILLIDDDDADRALTAALLRDAVPNAQVVEVTGAVEFAENYRHEGWDVAIGDTQLTWADGVSALRMLKRRNPRCATVVFSHGAPTSIGRLADVDGDGPDVFVKKVRAGYLQLVDIVRQVVSNSNDNDNLLDRARELSTDIQRLLACDTADIADDIVKLRESLQPISTALRLSADAQTDTNEHRAVELRRAIRAAMWKLAKELRRTKMRIRAGHLPSVYADARALQNFFIDLFTFSIKRTTQSGVCATVRTRTRPTDWLLSFRIEGIKPSKSDLEGLFDDETPQRPAGELARCARIAEAHGGNMWLEVDTDGSLTFLASLRIKVIDPVAVEVQYNGRPVGQVSVTNSENRNEITRAALSLPALSQDLTVSESTIKLVEFVDKGVVNIVA